MESVFIVFAVGAVSLSNGIKDAEFTETPRSRMMCLKWALLSLLLGSVLAFAVLLLFVPYLFSNLFPFSALFFDPSVATIFSGIIALIITVVFYNVTIR
ncbi:MAG: hypothetical protein QXU99_07630 [Candidatus Bathyarchaeia archaeon]